MIRIHSCVGYWMNRRTDEWIICCPFASFYLSWTNNRNDYKSYGVARSLFEHRTIVFNIRFGMILMYYKCAADEYLICVLCCASICLEDYTELLSFVENSLTDFRIKELFKLIEIPTTTKIIICFNVYFLTIYYFFCKFHFVCHRFLSDVPDINSKVNGIRKKCSIFCVRKIFVRRKSVKFHCFLDIAVFSNGFSIVNLHIRIECECDIPKYI